MLGISAEVPSLRTYHMLILYYMWYVGIPNYISVFVYPYYKCCILEVARPLLTCSLFSSVSSLESLGTVFPTSVPLLWPGSCLLRHRLSCSVSDSLPVVRRLCLPYEIKPNAPHMSEDILHALVGLWHCISATCHTLAFSVPFFCSSHLVVQRSSLLMT